MNVGGKYCMYFHVDLVAPILGEGVECAAPVYHSVECQIIGTVCPAIIVNNPQDIHLRCCNRVWCVSVLSAEWLQIRSAELTDVFWPLDTQHVAAACMSEGLTLRFCTKGCLHLPRSNQPKRLNVCIKFLLTCRVCPQHLKGTAHGTLHWV